MVLAIDTSRSVAGAPLTQAIAAAQLFVRSLPAGVSVGVLTFSDRPRVLVPITGDHESVLSSLVSVTRTQPGTKLYDGVAAAAAMFSGPAQHNIVLLTDGTDVGSALSLDQAIKAVSKVSATVFSVGLEGSRTDFAGLNKLSEATGGKLQAASTADLARLYQNLGTQLGRQYLVLYRSKGPAGAQVTIALITPAGEDLSKYFTPVDRGVTIGSFSFATRFWSDGSPRLTAYEYQGLLRSDCFRRGGMTCLSCHAMHAGDPHGQMRPDLPGDAICTQCHGAYSGTRLAQHTRHARASAGSRCVACHMPPVVYGIMNWHPTHEIVSPDPRAAAASGKPDACTWPRRT